MKKIYKIVFALIIFNCSFSSAQTYHKFLDSDTWYERTDDFSDTFHHWYYKAGDTLINSVNYTKIHSLPAFAHFYVREDTISKKVYIKNNAASADVLLYDFSLTAGSSFQVLGIYNTVVDSVNVAALSCGNRNRFYLSNNPFYHFVVIEEVGSIEDPFIFFNQVTDPVFTLVCNYEGNSICYQWALDTCATFVGIPNLQSSINNLQFSPNPLTTQSKLTFKNPSKEKFLFTLYDITGRVTESVSTTNNEIILTKGSKPAGIYLFNLVNEKTGERWNGKIMVE